MSILIKGMKMQINCQACFASDDECRFCKAAKEYIPMIGKPKFCPLIELPDHGDLIDRDIVWSNMVQTESFQEAQIALWNASVIIPSERSEE